jgi:hypothetical protein
MATATLINVATPEPALALLLSNTPLFVNVDNSGTRMWPNTVTMTSLSTWYNVTSLTLTPGTYVLFGAFELSTNGGPILGLVFSLTSANGTPVATMISSPQIANSGPIGMGVVAVVKVTATTTVYFNIENTGTGAGTIGTGGALAVQIA